MCVCVYKIHFLYVHKGVGFLSAQNSCEKRILRPELGASFKIALR